MIICAAIKVSFIDLSDEVQEMIVCGHRHQNCLYTIVHLSKKWTNWKIQGFINHKGEFMYENKLLLLENIKTGHIKHFYKLNKMD